MIFTLVQDFADVLEAMPQEHPRRRILALLDEAIRRDVHFIDRHPTTFFQCMWNTCWWYDCPEAAGHYDLSKRTGSSMLPWERPAVQRLATLMERWRAARDRQALEVAWLRSSRPPSVNLGSAQKLVLRGHDDGIDSVAWSPDGRFIASGARDNTARIWQVSSGQQLLCLRGHDDAVKGVSWSNDGRRLVSGSADKSVRIWDAATGEERYCMRGFRGHNLAVNALSWSPDGRLIASGSDDSTILIWDAIEGKRLKRLHQSWVKCVAWNCDSRRIVSGGDTQTVLVSDADNGERLLSLHGHEGDVVVNSVAFSPDGDRIASGSRDGTVRIWDAPTGRELLCFRGHSSGGVSSVAWSGDGRLIASAAYHDLTLRVWEAVSGQEVLGLQGHEDSITSVAWHGTQLVSGSLDGTVRVWDTVGGGETFCLREETVGRGAWSPNGQLIASRGPDVCIREATSGRGQLRFPFPAGTCMAWSGDGRRLAVALQDKTVRLWDAGSGEETLCLREHQNEVSILAWSRDGRYIASGSFYGGAVRIWDASSGQELRCLPVAGVVTDASWNRDGQRIAIAGGDDVRVWDIASGEHLLTLPDGGRPVIWSDDGSRLVTAGKHNGAVRIWDTASGVLLLCLPQHESDLRDIALSSDGRRVVVGVFDTITVWDAAKGACLQILDGVTDVEALAAGPSRFPFIALAHPMEVVVLAAGMGQPVAWLAQSCVDSRLTVVANPTGRAWAGVPGRQFWMVSLEGIDHAFAGALPQSCPAAPAGVAGNWWFYSDDRRRAWGPVRAKELKKLVESGDLSKDALVSRDNMKLHVATKLRGVKWPDG